MERLAKRQRLFATSDGRFPNKFDNHHEFYQSPHRELEEEEDEEEEVEEDFSPDEELQNKRAQLDYKLKSTFESIFAKYERNFDGIGDEIDLYTGEILVNNGHLLRMDDEKDAGISIDSHSRLGYTTPETEEATNSSMGEDHEDIEEEEVDEEEGSSDDEMPDDDLLLRGFAQASQFMKQKLSPEPPSFIDAFIEPESSRPSAVSRLSFGGGDFPTNSQIMSQFGPQHGPDIINYMKRQVAFEDTSIEPAWQAPPIPVAPAIPGRRPRIRPATRLPEIERSPSPENGASIWGPTNKQRDRGPKFTKKDDELLLDFVAEARRRGLYISSQLTWQQLEAAYPHHKWSSWKSHYKRKFAFFAPENDESEISTSEAALDHQIPSAQVIKRKESRALKAGAQRSTRIRKPAQRDPNIMTWSEAVPILESDDPFQHAELLRDARRTHIGATFRFNHPTPASSNVPESHASPRKLVSSPRLHQYPDISNPVRQAKAGLEGSHDGAEDELALDDPALVLRSPQKKLCPHVSCRAYSSATYRTSRRINEEMSPFVDHLWHVHQSTPYPCTENNCDRNGNQGYFMQIDLVRHIKEAHPHPAALQRLRGRVNSEFLDPRFDSRMPRRPAEVPRPFTPGAPPIDSDFFSPQRRQTTTSNELIPSIPSHGLHVTPRNAQGTKVINIAEGSSLHVNHSSATVKDVQLVVSEQQDHDSDVEILDVNPFPNRDTPTRRNKQTCFCPMKDAMGCLKNFTTASSAVNHDKIHTTDIVQFGYPSCERLTSTAQSGPTKAHLEWHERQRSLSVSVHNGPPEQRSLSSSIPDSQRASVDLDSSAPAAISPTRFFLRQKQVASELPRNVVDLSYEFSDEEEMIQSTSRRAPNITHQRDPVAFNQTASQPAEEISKNNSDQTEDPQMSRADIDAPAQKPPPIKLMDATEAEAPRSSKEVTLTANKAVSAVKSPPVPAASTVTPGVRQSLRKSALLETVDAEDLDELSLGADDFVLLSSRSRLGLQPMNEPHVRVKDEDDVQPSSELPIRKRRYSALCNDEIDELATDEGHHGMSTGIQSRIKREQDSSAEIGRPMLIQTKLMRKRLSGDVVNSISQTEPAKRQREPIPAKNQHKPTRTSTPLIDLTAIGNSKICEVSRANISIPSTSEIASSPTTHMIESSSPVLALLPPIRRKHHAAKKTIKREEEDGIVKTPGGTLRRCGRDSFACGRPFCFTCGSAVAH